MHFDSYIALTVTVVAAIELHVVGAGGQTFAQLHCALTDHDTHQYRMRAGDRAEGPDFGVALKIQCPCKVDTPNEMCTVYSLQGAGKQLAEAQAEKKTKAFTASFSETELQNILAGPSIAELKKKAELKENTKNGNEVEKKQLADRQKAETEQKFKLTCHKYVAPVIDNAQ